MDLVKLAKGDIVLGVASPWNIRNASGQLLLAQGKLLSSMSQLESLIERGAYVYASEVGHDGPVEDKQASDRATVIFDLWRRATDRLAALVKTIETDRTFSFEIHRLAQDIGALVARDTDIAIYLTVRQDQVGYQHYGHAHSVYTALVCILLATRMGWPEDRVLLLTKAALTMNVAIADLQSTMAEQYGPVRKEQHAQIRQHPAAAVALLSKSGVTNKDWLVAVFQHHERADGTGYPSGTKNVAPLAQALRLADVFMAKISPRRLRPALSTQDAARQMFLEDGGGPTSMAIIKEFGIYPPGDHVRLKSGELGVVVRRRANANAPIVVAATDADQRPIARLVMRNTAYSEFAITGPEADRSRIGHISPRRLYGFAFVVDDA